MLTSAGKTVEPPAAVNLRCPSLLSYEREELIRYLRMTPTQRTEMFKAAQEDPRTSGSLLHAMQWLFTA